MHSNVKGINVMKINKKGFTLSEVLVCITIIGVIMALSMNSIRIVKASYTALTYFAFNNLQNMVGTIYSGRNAYTTAESQMVTVKKKDENGNIVDTQEKQIKTTGGGLEMLIHPVCTESSIDSCKIPQAFDYCRKPNGTIITVLKNDIEYENRKNIPSCSARSSTDSATSADSIFCLSVASIANINGKPKCKTATDLFNVNTSGSEPYIDNLPTGKREKLGSTQNFTTSNGQRFFISKWAKSNSVSSEYGFRLVAIDLNGKSNPNKYVATETMAPDYVTFLVLDNGEVFPLGVAADNLPRGGDRTVIYLNSQVKGYYFDTYNPEGRKNVPAECLKLNEDGKQMCNFAVVPVERAISSEKKVNFMSYREAYCLSHDHNSLAYTGYCPSGYSKSQYCPPSSNAQRFDQCRVENVKPAFRYNFK